MTDDALDIHVVHFGDRFDHVCRVDCWCKPEVVEDEFGRRIYTHKEGGDGQDQSH